MGAIVNNIPIIDNTEPYFVSIGNSHIKFKYDFIEKDNASLEIKIIDLKTGMLEKTMEYPYLTEIDLDEDGYYTVEFDLPWVFGFSSTEAEDFYANYKNQQFYVYIIIEDGKTLKSPIVVKNLIYKPSVAIYVNDTTTNLFNTQTYSNNFNFLMNFSRSKLNIEYDPGRDDDIDKISHIILNFYKGDKRLKLINEYLISPSLNYDVIFNFDTDLLAEFLSDYFYNNTKSEGELDIALELVTQKGFKVFWNCTFQWDLKSGFINSSSSSYKDNVNSFNNNSSFNLKENYFSCLAQINTTVKNGTVVQLLLYRKELGKDNKELICLQKNSFNNSTSLTASLRDYFIEPGKTYEYCILGGTFNKATGYIEKYIPSCLKTIDPITLISEDIYLYTPSQTLAIKYNPSLNQYKYNVAEAVVNTIGGQYPYIMQNGNQKYRTFTIGGLISYNSELEDSYYVTNNQTGSNFKSNFSDSRGDAKLSLDPFRNSLFLNNTPLLTNEQKKLPLEHQRIISEKVFRDKVIEFLYSKQPMLFKSLQEGLIVVKLTQISLTPNAQLGRNIYSFSATAVEIADNSVETLREIFQS